MAAPGEDPETSSLSGGNDSNIPSSVATAPPVGSSEANGIATSSSSPPPAGEVSSNTDAMSTTLSLQQRIVDEGKLVATASPPHYICHCLYFFPIPCYVMLCYAMLWVAH
jgi:hypothetical protein